MAKRSKKKKKKKSSVRRGHKKDSSGWKKSKGVAVVLVVLIICTWGYMIKDCAGPPMLLMEDYPYTYCTEKTRKIIVKRADSNQQPKVPFKSDEGGDEWCWPAYVCANPECPWLRKHPDDPLKFPHVTEYLRKVATGEIDSETASEDQMPPELMMGMEAMPECPACKAKKIESYQVKRYETEEGKKKQQAFRKMIRERYEKDK